MSRVAYPVDARPETRDARQGTVKTLVIRLSSLGDVTLATGILDPTGKAKVDFLTREEYARLLDGHPGIGRVLALGRGNARLLRAEMLAGSYEAVLDLQNNARSRLLSRLARARTVRVKKQSARRRLGIVFRPLLKGVKHRLDTYLEAAAELGLEGGGEPRLFPGKKLVQQWRQALVEGGVAKLVGIAPGALWKTKRWPLAGYVELIRELAREGERRFVLVGGFADRKLCKVIEAKAGTKVVNLAGGTEGMQLAALLSACDVLVSNDSGPMHVAGAVGTPVVAIFGSTTTRLGFAPRGSKNEVVETKLWCRPCDVHGRRFCPLIHMGCVKNVKPESMAQAVERLM